MAAKVTYREELSNEEEDFECDPEGDTDFEASD